MTLEKQSLILLEEALEKLAEGFLNLPEFHTQTNLTAIKPVLLEVAERMQDNFPYHHPLYVGQMLKPPLPIARLAYMLSLWINPNNHALDGGRASSLMEKEAVTEIAQMFKWESHLGHLCSGGTMANLEALWIASLECPNKKIIASSQAHYTHQRLCQVLGLSFDTVPCNNQGCMDINALKNLLNTGDIGTVVVTMGTTATGSVDPLAEILKLQSEYNFRIHADAAYGGYFTLVNNLDSSTRKAFDSLSQVDSIVIDPHKHGLQPYGCGCILFKDVSVGKHYKHDSPYTYFSSDELHLGEISLECSRPGSAAVALWATQKLLPMVQNGEFANNLSKSRQAAIALFHKLQKDKRFITAFPPQLDIVVWFPKAKSVSKTSLLSQSIFEKAASQNLHLDLAKLPIEFFKYNYQNQYQDNNLDIEWDEEYITCLRSCLMKPEHLKWLDEIWQILDQVTNDVVCS
ncbi:MAG: aminotransferase class I/II-fold pyridoxal phosphate-dependent enzyme [Cyanobacteria bacterium P01_A01_bin.84]